MLFLFSAKSKRGPTFMNVFGVTTASLTVNGFNAASSVVALMTAVSSMSRRLKLRKKEARLEIGPLRLPSNARRW